MNINPLLIGAVVVGAVLVLSHKSASAAPASGGMLDLPKVSLVPLDENMSPEQFKLWQTLIALEGRPDVLKSQADGYGAAGFPNSSSQLRLKETILRREMALRAA